MKGMFAGLVWPPRGCEAEIGAGWRLWGGRFLLTIRNTLLNQELYSKGKGILEVVSFHSWGHPAKACWPFISDAIEGT